MLKPNAISAIDREDMCAAVGCGGRWARHFSTDIPLCIYHFHEAFVAVELMNERTEQYMADDAARRGIVRTPEPKTVLRKPKGGPVVYYVQMNEHIKIGMTTSFYRRMGEFYAQPEDVLAIEPGGRALEKSRHQQFTPFRVRGTELFRPNSILTELIEELRAKEPNPWLAAEAINHPAAYREEVAI